MAGRENIWLPGWQHWHGGLQESERQHLVAFKIQDGCRKQPQDMQYEEMATELTLISLMELVLTVELRNFSL